MKIKFTKMVGTGNDFIVIDNRKKQIDPQNISLIKKLCTQHYGIGADGLILLEKSKIANFKMRFFNPNGQEAEMCGNGARCIALFAKNLKIVDKKMVFETKAGIINAEVKGKVVKIKLTNPKNIKLNIKLGKISGHFINTGVPHFVIITDDIENIDVMTLGSKVRYHSYFKPGGTNVDFIKIEKDCLYIRTYERGVEAETFSCGTGIVASAIIAHLTKNIKSPVKVITKNNEILKVYFTKKNNEITEIYLEGEAKIVFIGEKNEQEN